MHVSIVGTGYVGLVTGACLAEKGHQVICVDIDQDKVDAINQARPPIYEKGLAELVEKNASVKLRATTDVRQAVRDTELTFIAVGTPFVGNAIDLQYVRAASRQIGQALAEKSTYHVVVVKSTVVPGTTDDVVVPILEASSGKIAGVDFGVGMNPEFLREGEAVQDFMFPDRLVLGGSDAQTQDVLEKLYQVFPSVEKLKIGNKTAEMIKYTSNALLATMVSFSNEIANLCTALGGIDVVEVMQAVHLDKRLSPILDNGTRIRPAFTTYLEAGCGFGGSCFPKDVKALIAHGAQVNQPMSLLNAVIQVNERQPQKMLDILHKHYPSLVDIPIAVLGLAFKPGTNDIRESPALPIVRFLLEHKAIIKAYDPIAREEAAALFGHDRVKYCDSLEKTLQGVEAALLLTRWDEFTELPRLLAAMKPSPLLIDGRRMIDKRQVARYQGIGM